MTDQEKNEAVARKLGWIEDLPASSPVGDADGCLWIKGSDTSKHYRLPDYCHSIEAAWGVVEEYGEIQFNGTKKFFIVQNDLNQWLCGWVKRHYYGEWESVFDTVASTAPMAIVEAFLKFP